MVAVFGVSDVPIAVAPVSNLNCPCKLNSNNVLANARLLFKKLTEVPPELKDTIKKLENLDFKDEDEDNESA